MQIFGRQGDLVIDRKSDTVLPELETAPIVSDFVFAGDSSGHPHTLLGKVRMKKNGTHTLIFLPEPSRMTHGKSDGHQDVAEMPAGSYDVYPLREQDKESERAVAD